MKTQTIKALQELCDALMYDVQPQPYPWTRTKNAADILSRVLDEEPNSELIFKHGTICKPNYDPLLDE